jgi:hypothetical protein
MNGIPRTLKTMKAQVLHFVALPLFFLFFIVLYGPVGDQELLQVGRGNPYYFNATMMTCIILGIITGMRIGFHFIWRSKPLAIGWYIGWCVGELILMALFCGLYICLRSRTEIPYFFAVGRCFSMISLVLIYPYSIICLLLMQIGMTQDAKQIEEENSLVRFQDENGRLKLVISPNTILFLASEENYVRIHYTEGEKVKEYLLRTSMKALEPLCARHGLVRCQRSFFINPKHIKVLRKDKEGLILAELDSTDREIPVSRRYYEELSSRL